MKLNHLKAYIIIIVTVIIAFYPLSFLIHPFKYDFFDGFYPFRYFLGDCIKNGTLPFWLPYQNLGYPFYADPESGFFYPISWIVGSIFGYSLNVLQIELVLHFILAGIGFYHLVNYIHKNIGIALVLGISYALSGFFVGNAQHYPWIISGTWLPFVILYFIHFIKTSNFKNSISFALCLTMFVTGGYTAFTIITGYILIIGLLMYIIPLVKKDPKELLIKLFPKYLFCAGLIILLCGGYLISIYSVSNFITRGDGVTLKHALSHPFLPTSLISLIIPFATVKDYMNIYHADMSMINAYIGIITLVVFIYSLTRKQDKRYYLILGASIFMLLISFGSILPLRELLYRYIPFMNYFRFPSAFRLFFIVGFLLCAGYGYKNILNRKKATIKILGLLIIILAGMVFFAKKNAYLNFIHVLTHELFVDSQNTNVYQHIAVQSVFQIGLLALICIAVFFIKKDFLLKRIIFVFIVIDLILSCWLNSPYTVYYHQFRNREIAKYEKSFTNGFPVPGTKKIIDVHDQGRSHLAYWRNLSIFSKEIAYDGYNPFFMSSYEELEQTPELLKTSLNNRFVYFANKVIPYDSLEFYVRNKRLTPKTIVVKNSEYKFFSEYNYNGKSLSELNVVHYTPLDCNISVNTTEERLLIFMQNFYPGWKVFVNHQPQNIIIVNKTLMGVKVPAGKQMVRFRFRPRLIEFVGFWVSFFIFLGLGIYQIYRMILKRIEFFN